MPIATVRDSIQNTRTIPYTHNAATAVGDIIVINGAVLIAVNKADADKANAYVYQARVEMPKEVSLAVNEFDRVFWDSVNGKITKTSGGNTFCGYCAEKALAADTVIQIILMPSEALSLNGDIFKKVTVATLNTAGDISYSAAQLTGRMILRDPNGGARSDTTPTAAQIVAAIPHAKAGDAFYITIRNTADAAEAITVVAGTGVTLSGTATIAQNNTKIFLCLLTNVTASSEAVTFYSVGTLVH